MPTETISANGATKPIRASGLIAVSVYNTAGTGTFSVTPRWDLAGAGNLRPMDDPITDNRGKIFGDRLRFEVDMDFDVVVAGGAVLEIVYRAT